MKDSECFGTLLRVVNKSKRISRLLGELEKAEKKKAAVSENKKDRKDPKDPSSPGGASPPPLPPNSKTLYGDVIVTCRMCHDYGAEEHARAFVQAPPLSVVLCSNRLER
jgi:hypothetical protein